MSDARTSLSMPAASVGSSNTGAADPPDSLDPPPRIRGYELTRILGRGGMGVVWRAVQLGTRREVALKVLTASLHASTSARRRFDREVELAAKLEHRYVARVYESGLNEGVFFYAMELVWGIPLDRYVAERQLSQRQALELMRCVIDAVQHAHQRGVIHRDLKPSNILVTSAGEPKVVDFGLAKAWQAEAADEGGQPLTIDGDFVGTPEYVSPEQARGREVDTRSDVYSLGVIVYRLMTGRPPHGETGSREELLQRIREQDVPRRFSPKLDRDLSVILLKALARDPNERYASAAALGDDLGRFLRGDPITARPPTLRYFVSRRVRRLRRALSVALFVLAGVSGLLAAYAYHVGVQTNRGAFSRHAQQMRAALVNRLDAQLSSIRALDLMLRSGVRPTEAQLRPLVNELRTRSYIPAIGVSARAEGGHSWMAEQLDWRFARTPTAPPQKTTSQPAESHAVLFWDGSPLLSPAGDSVTSSENVLGYDLHTNANLAPAMDAATTTGVAAVSGKVALDRLTSGEPASCYGVYVFIPMYRHFVSGRQIGDHAGYSAGHLFIVLSLDDLVERLFLSDPIPASNLRLYDGKDETPEALLADSGRRRGRRARAMGQATEASGAPSFRHSEQITICGRPFTLQWESRPPFDSSPSKLTIGLAAFALTTLAGGICLRWSLRREGLELKS